jgi:hypothetical protein
MAGASVRRSKQHEYRRDRLTRRAAVPDPRPRRRVETYSLIANAGVGYAGLEMRETRDAQVPRHDDEWRPPRQLAAPACFSWFASSSALASISFDAGLLTALNVGRDLVGHVDRVDDDQSGLTLAEHVPERLEVLVVHAALHMAGDRADRRAGATATTSPPRRPTAGKIAHAAPTASPQPSPCAAP